MITQTEYISEDKIKNHEIIKEASGILKKGGLVVFPTETLYGIGADVFNKSACAKIYEVKKRPLKKPLIVLISEIEQLSMVADDVPDIAFVLAKRFWPGPLTIVLKKNKNIPDIVSAGTGTVAVRFTSSKTAQELICEAKTPIVAPSANISGKPGAKEKSELKEMDGEVDMIIVNDSETLGGESSIVDVRNGKVQILRKGVIKSEDIMAAAFS